MLDDGRESGRWMFGKARVWKRGPVLSVLCVVWQYIYTFTCPALPCTGRGCLEIAWAKRTEFGVNQHERSCWGEKMAAKRGI